MGKSSADEKILSYNDVVLRRSDLDILSGPYFLNDRIIEFYFSHLTFCHSSDDILFVPPSISFWIMNCPDSGSLKDFLAPLNLSSKKLVIFPVNDNDDVTEAEGGTHWSLLAFGRDASKFVHHDSYRGCNNRHARKLYETVARFMGTSNSASYDGYLDCPESPQQVNSYDCGLYVTAIARVICCWYRSDESKDASGLWFSVMKEQVTPSTVAEMRREILGLIKGLMSSQGSSVYINE
ncbi:NEDD8-specific protease 1 [Malania oleifera]|uniref:NEDD8-specific protease 1 n=1 Tax=Malania oleifera TaxID=397392 RepID=UPI0025AE6D13|nr:NEDD8-specific protease 1 [Malania oleifera]XP_057956130.1 NEDD8-specific protease 1 [Malania oleifera]XP_057956131.1 NEDD8-specific protease 1 [Malania oleifera]XP_057956132.1 NEDD8-specific protease 1 [Malania oleifera]XP_057956133.1 NEDD8-specific protease 1 [Malania oleifera]XP_057956134.1 NEDD8-specific protease 1 [Malania oleifera]XP_057956135.1 NEDD8-specific protease 1 [Malania oleifera]XP_057956136.1 NEDD8-specific protease 1 [Malania oleifera]XP_057956137.1 NEDD8-specific prote